MTTITNDMRKLGGADLARLAANGNAEARAEIERRAAKRAEHGKPPLRWAADGTLIERPTRKADQPTAPALVATAAPAPTDIAAIIAAQVAAALSAAGLPVAAPVAPVAQPDPVAPTAKRDPAEIKRERLANLAKANAAKRAKQHADANPQPVIAPTAPTEIGDAADVKALREALREARYAIAATRKLHADTAAELAAARTEIAKLSAAIRPAARAAK